MWTGLKNSSCRHSNPALWSMDFHLTPHLVTVTKTWWRRWRGWNNKTVPSLFASFPVIAAEPEVVPLAEILSFRNPPVSSIVKQRGAGPAFTTFTPTYSSDWWSIVEEWQGIGNHWEKECTSQSLNHVVLTHLMEVVLAPSFQSSVRMVTVSFPFGTNLTQWLQSEQDFRSSSMTVGRHISPSTSSFDLLHSFPCPPCSVFLYS